MRVFIADDSPLIVEHLVAALAEVKGVEIVGTAGTGAGASDGIRRLKPEVVILDIAMPGGSGISVLEGIKRDHLNPIAIVLTNNQQRQYRKRCLEYGARFFFDKSSEFEKVAETLQGLVAATPAPDITKPNPSCRVQGIVRI